MDVLKPELVWVEGRCYRKNPSRNNYGLQRNSCSNGNGTRTQQAISVPVPYREPDDEYMGCDPDAPDEIDDAYEIEELSSGGFKTHCSDIPSALFASVIGTKGAVKKRIEQETKTKIVIPRMNEKGDIVIRGQTLKDVANARRRIDLISSQSRFKREPTHFLCFPLNAPSVVQNVREFKDKVLTDFKSPSFGIDSKVFQEPEKIHLTLSVLMLLEPKERNAAAEILEGIKSDLRDIASAGSLRVRLQGIEIMNDDPTQVDVLYAKCAFQSSAVQKLADRVSDVFLASGFAKENRGDSVKLHATLINSRLRNEGEAEETADGGVRNRARQSINAKELLEKYGDYDFGFVEIKEVHLSTRYTKGSDGFYNAFSKISLK